MWHYCCVIPYAACIRQLMCIHFPTLRPSLKTTTHQPPTETTWFRIPRLLLVYLKLSNPFNTSPPQIKLSKPTPIHAKHDLCLILLDFLTNVMYERQSSCSTTPLLFNSKLSSFYISQHFHSLQNESDLWERSNCALSFYLSRKRRACLWWRRGKTDWNECLSATRHFHLHLTLFGFFQPTTFSLANKQSKSIISTPSAIHSRR